MTPDPRDVRDAETLARRNALRLFEDAANVVRHAPPVAHDRLAAEHALKLAQALMRAGHAWVDIAKVHDEYAVELEQQKASA